MRSAAPAQTSHPTPASELRRWTLGELGGWDTILPLEARGRELGDLLLAEPDLPGVLLADAGAIRGAISRRGYLDLIGRYCGMDLYHPRPLRLMAERLEKERGESLVLAAETSLEEAVRHALERPHELVYEPIVVQGVEGDVVRLLDFESVLLAHTERTAQRNEQMRQILATVREGLLIVDRHGRLGTEASLSARQIVGFDLAGLTLQEIVAALAGSDLGELAGGYLEPLFSPRVAESLIAQINPIRELTTLDGRRLETRFVRGMVDGEIRHVLVHLQDVSAERDLAARVAEERARAEERLDVALTLVGADAEAVKSLLGALEVARDGFERTDNASAATRLSTKRSLHRLKGEAAMLGLASLAAAAHRLESALAEGDVAAPADVGRLADLETAVRGVVARLTAWSSVVAATPLDHQRPAPEELGAEWEARARRLVDTVAGDEGKQVDLRVTVHPHDLAPAFLDLLRIAVPQLLRNAVVHGIELPATRLARGKAAEGRIDLEIQRRDGWMELVVQDDGRGLDLESLRRSGVERGVPAELMADPRQLVFVAGVSTTDQLSEHAGRGVGLDLVLAEARARGGDAEVHGEAGSWCAFRVVVPA